MRLETLLVTSGSTSTAACLRLTPDADSPDVSEVKNARSSRSDTLAAGPNLEGDTDTLRSERAATGAL